MAQPVIVDGNKGQDDVLLVISNSVAIAVGDLITYESSTAIKMAAANKDVYFAGIAIQKKVASDGQTTLLVRKNPIAWIDATSASYTIGAKVKWTSANTVVASGGSDEIGTVIGLPTAGAATETCSRVKVDFSTTKFWNTLAA
jgi:hypothetical protein